MKMLYGSVVLFDEKMWRKQSNRHFVW